MSGEEKRGRGKPAGTLKENAMRATLKLRLPDELLADAHRAANLLGEDISKFVRVAIQNRCKETR